MKVCATPLICMTGPPVISPDEFQAGSKRPCSRKARRATVKAISMMARTPGGAGFQVQGCPAAPERDNGGEQDDADDDLNGGGGVEAEAEPAADAERAVE